MVVEPIPCPACQGTDVVKPGKTSAGKQRFRCQHETCPSVTCLREYVDQGRRPSGKRQIIERSLKARGSREIARVGRGSPTTVRQELKTSASPASRPSTQVSVEPL
jgi:transposase-like protein